jgi:hypothetical protein
VKVVPHSQLISQLPADDGQPSFAISASKDLEPGSRAALIIVQRLFRLDVVVAGDTLRTVVRNLSTGTVEVEHDRHNAPGTNVVQGEAIAHEPARAAVAFTLSDERERLGVRVMIGTLRLADRGVTRVSAQAVVRRTAALALVSAPVPAVEPVPTAGGD